MADTFTRLIEISQKLESLLERRYGAHGRGLHEKLTSVENQIPRDIQKKIRFIATIRNNATHEDINLAQKNFNVVREAYRAVLPVLDGGRSRRRAMLRKALAAVIVTVILALLIKLCQFL
ncbi:MAG: hypothetical protein IKW74_06990 [Thermoguttaceae bacterium]|nr:hypothetical protein [Thermoguttaceae bacterium]